MTISEVKTFCRVCTAACGIIVEVEGDQVIRVRGDTDHPISGGYTCSKGRALPMAHHHPNRIERPRVMRDGVKFEAGWDAVLDDLCERLRTIIAESGPEAVGFFLGGGGYMDAGGYLAARAAPAALKTPSVYSDMTIDVISKLLVSEMMAGVGGLMSRPDFERCKLVLYIGTNPLVSHGHTSMLTSPTERLRELMAQGEVWVLDPRRSETARRATRHLAPRHGTDWAILAYLVREILRDGADRAYLAAHAQDVDRLAEIVEPFDLGRAGEISGLSQIDLSDLLAAVRKAGRLSVETGTGISMSAAANVTQWLSWALMIVTGSLDSEGGSWVNPGFLLQIDKMDIPPAPPEGWRGPGPRTRPELRSVGGEYACAAMPNEIEAGNLRAVINLGGNLVACLPGTDRAVAALRRLDVLASIDIIENATTEISTHVLPSKDQLERADLPYAVDIAYPSVTTQLGHPAVEPVGERRSFWWIMAEIGRRLDLEFLPGIDPATATDLDVLGRIAGGGRQTMEALASGDVVTAEPVAIGWVRKLADRIGGFRLTPPDLVAQLETLSGSTGLIMIPRRQANHINSRFTDLKDKPGILVSREDAAAAGLSDGGWATVRSRFGAVKGVVTIDPNLPAGILSVPHGWSGAANANQLTSGDDVDPLTGMPLFSGLAVTLHASN